MAGAWVEWRIVSGRRGWLGVTNRKIKTNTDAATANQNSRSREEQRRDRYGVEKYSLIVELKIESLPASVRMPATVVL